MNIITIIFQVCILLHCLKFMLTFEVSRRMTFQPVSTSHTQGRLYALALFSGGNNFDYCN